MAEYITLRWAPRFEGLSRRDREGCSYNAYLPDPLQGWNPALPGDLAADIADAEAAVRDLNQTRAVRIGGEGLARFLLRAESAASSRIEGLAAGPRRLADAEAVIAPGRRPRRPDRGRDPGQHRCDGDRRRAGGPGNRISPWTIFSPSTER